MSVNQLDHKARQRSYTILANMYPKVFRRVLNEQREKVGLPPVGTLRPGPKMVQR